MSREAPATAGSPSTLSVLLWLMVTAVVAVVGTALLEQAQVSRWLASTSESLAILVGEAILYLLVFTMLSAGRIGAGRAFAGTIIGLVVRAMLALVTAEAPVVSRSGAASFLDSFVYFYLLYWPGVVVQICAVAIFLWALRDIWVCPDSDELKAPREMQLAVDECEDWAERQRVLLAALRESDSQEQDEVTAGAGSPSDSSVAAAGFYSNLDTSISLTLPFERAETLKSGPDSSAEETSAMAVVTEGAQQGASAEVTPAADEAQSDAEVSETQPAGEQLLPQWAVSGITPFAGGVLVWGAEFALDDTQLAAAAGPLVAGASDLAQATAIGALQLLLIEADEGCGTLSVSLDRDDWWVGLMQSGAAGPGRIVVAARQAIARLHETEMPPEMSYPDPLSLAVLPMQPQTLSHQLADPLMEKWSLKLSIAQVKATTVLAALPAGRDATSVISAGWHLWQAAAKVSELSNWSQPQVVLVQGEVGGVAVGRASWQGEPALLVVYSRDIIRMAGAGVLLAELAGKLDDYGPRYRPGADRSLPASTK